MELACQCPAVVVCRCSPTQKAEIVKLIRAHTGVRTCAIGTALLCLQIAFSIYSYISLYLSHCLAAIIIK